MSFTITESLIAEDEAVSERINGDRFIVGNLACEDLFRQIVEHVTLDGTFHGPCTELGVVANLCEILNGCVGYFKSEALRFEHLPNGVDL